MPRAAGYGWLAALAAAIALGAWWIARSDPPPHPPQLDADADVDPQVAHAASTALRAVHASPRDAAARAGLAMVYHANGLLTLAAETYEQALAIDDRPARWWYYLAQVRAAQNDLDAALQNIHRAIALDPGFAPLHWRRGFWLMDQGRIDNAEAALRRALELDPRDPAASVGLARVHLHRRQYDKAASLLRTMLQAAGSPPPNAPYVRQLLGTAELHLGSAAPASSHLVQARGDPIHWPDEWDREVRRLRTGYRATLDELDWLINSNQFAAAIAKAQSLLRAKPGDAGASNYLALGHFGLEQWDQGIAALADSLAREPNHFATHLNLARGYQGKGDLNRALAHAQRAVDINPGLGFTHLAVGRALLALNRPQDAVEPLMNALHAGLNEPDVRVLLGDTLLGLQRWREAARVFEQTIELAPEYAAAYAGLARASAELGDLATARAAIQRAAQIDPSLPSLQPIAARINELQRRASGNQ